MCLTKMKSRIRHPLSALLSLFAVVALGACSKSDKPQISGATPQPSPSSKQADTTSAAAKTQAFTGIDSCKLLSKEEIQELG